ncbi:MAG: polysaccharide biosynthesis tyrosine autokinase [Anaerolineae bacterium]|nr:polysaccharide biosynthesis tyrosine autokinase [Anaerolineae bacterium]
MDIRAYIAPLIKWWWLILASTLIAGGASYVATSQQQATYRAVSTVVAGQIINDPNPNGNELYLGQQLARSYADTAKRASVRQATMDAIGLTWLPPYEVVVLPDSLLIEIHVTDANPNRAIVVANELANQLILRSPSNLQQEEQERQSFINQQLDDLQVDISETKAEIEAKQNELGELFSARQIAETQNLIGVLEAKLTSLQANFAALLDNTQQGATNTLSLYESAESAFEITSNQLITVLASAAIGFVLGASAAYLLEFLDDTVKTPTDIEQLTNLPTLATIGRSKVTYNSDTIEAIKHPRSPVSESFRVLRTSIQFSGIDSDNKTILITSPNPGEGKSTTAGNLGVVMAQARFNVLIVDADLRRATQHKRFGLSSARGLTNLLLELDSDNSAQDVDALLAESIQPTTEDKLYLLTSGPIPPNPSELLGSARMKTLLELLADRYDYVVIDSSPVLAVTDAVVLGAQVDSVVIVAAANKTRRAHLKRTVNKLQEVNANIIGLSLNLIAAADAGSYSYYSYGRVYGADSLPSSGTRSEESAETGGRRWFGRKPKPAGD